MKKNYTNKLPEFFNSKISRNRKIGIMFCAFLLLSVTNIFASHFRYGAVTASRLTETATNTLLNNHDGNWDVYTMLLGQETEALPNATISNQMLITIDSAAGVHSKYIADISTLHFESEEEAINFFNSFRDNLVSFEVDYPNKKIVIIIYLEFAPAEWSFADWNIYFKQKAKSYSEIPN